MELQDINLKDLIEKETGEKFNREGYIKCPFHNEKTPSMSVKFFPDSNKEKFMCWGCNESGDAIDFISKIKNLKFNEARKYLGMEVKKSQKEEALEKVKSYIEWQINNLDFRKNNKLIGLFSFVDEHNKILYYKAKFRKPDGNKDIAYYHIEENKVVNKRGHEEVPYNYFNLLDAIDNNKEIIFVEGEKDANTVNSILKGEDYISTSIKSCKDLEAIKTKGIRVIVIGDTGKAGDNYKWHIYKELYQYSSEFRFVNLPGIKALGDNKDVTDWIETGKSKDDLIKAINRSLDLKDSYELQQDKKGIYKILIKSTDDGIVEKKIYLTDFTLLEATRLLFVEDDIEGVKIKVKSCTGDIIEKTGPATVFDDVRSFKNFLGTLDLSFKGRIDDLTMLKGWINKYWAIENESIYSGTQFIEDNGSIVLVTNTGALTSNNLDLSKKSDKSDCVDISNVEHITKKELMELKKHLFKFAAADKSISIIGTIVNDLCVYQNMCNKEAFHHLLIVGESGSGKSTILKNVVAAILNYPRNDIKSIGLITPFALIKELSNGNYPVLFDEFKPSMMDKYKTQKISDTLRNLYDRQVVARSDKSFSTTNFQLRRPIIIAGEESYPNKEKALINRSAIVYLSKNERTTENTAAMEWIINNEIILNKFGRSLIDVTINLSPQDYKAIRNKFKDKYKKIKDRPLNTAMNISTGIEIINILLKKHKLKELKNYEKYIIQNISEEILEGGEDTKSTVEQMLILYNDMIADGRAIEFKDVIKDRGDGLFIRTNEMINQIHVFVNQVGSAELVPLKASDFKKQAKKAGYLLNLNSKYIKIDGKTCRFDEYSKERVRGLNVDLIVEPELTPVDDDQKVIEGIFDSKGAS